MMIDTHVHYGDKCYKNDLIEVVKRDREAGVVRTICLPVKYEDNRTMMTAAEGIGDMYFGVGIHPLQVPQYPTLPSPKEEYSLKKELAACEKRKLAFEKDRNTLLMFQGMMKDLSDLIDECTGSGRIAAIGETGIDTFKSKNLIMQKISLYQHFLLAIKYDLPVVLHIRGENALDETMKVMNKLRSPKRGFRGVWHCFLGSKADMDKLQDGNNDFVFGIGGKITDKEGYRILSKTLLSFPDKGEALSKIVLETDAPYLLPHKDAEEQNRDTRNVSANLPVVVQTIAKILNVEDEVVIEHTAKNAFRMFFPGEI